MFASRKSLSFVAQEFQLLGETLIINYCLEEFFSVALILIVYEAIVCLEKVSASMCS